MEAITFKTNKKTEKPQTICLQIIFFFFIYLYIMEQSTLKIHWQYWQINDISIATYSQIGHRTRDLFYDTKVGMTCSLVHLFLTIESPYKRTIGQHLCADLPKGCSKFTILCCRWWLTTATVVEIHPPNTLKLGNSCTVESCSWTLLLKWIKKKSKIKKGNIRKCQEEN